MLLSTKMSQVWLSAMLLSLAASPLLAADSRLIEAVRGRHAAEAKALIEKNAVDVNVREGDGATALQWATHVDDMDTMKLLIQKGADVNASNDLGVTPLSIAASKNNPAMV